MRKQLVDGQFDADNFWRDIRRVEVGGHLGDVIGTLAGTLGAEGVDSKAGGGDSKWMSLSDTRTQCPKRTQTHTHKYTHTQTHTYTYTQEGTPNGQVFQTNVYTMSNTLQNYICILGSCSILA